MAEKGPTHRVAVGLNYVDGKDDAPEVSVKGDALMADEVVRIARRFGIPVVENPEMARALNTVEVDQQIPRNLFETVAILLNQLSQRLRKR